MIARPTTGEMVPYFEKYVAKVAGDDLFAGLEAAHAMVATTLAGIPADREEHRYAEGKWSIKEVLLHVIDTERIFGYRALSFARAEPSPLPGFDENAYIDEANTTDRSLADLLTEYDAVHRSTIALFKGLGPAVQERTGIANGKRLSVRAAGWIIAGHAMHHMSIINERYR